MKKFLALLLSLLMALSCFGAMAETDSSVPALELPEMTITSALRVDEEMVDALLPMLGLDENTAGMAKTFLPILNNLTEQFVIGGNGGEFDLFLKDSAVASIALEQSGNGFALATDLLPSFVIAISEEDIAGLMEQFTSQMNDSLAGVDVSALAEKLVTYVAEYSEAIMGAISMGEPEMGEFTFEGIDAAFNTKTQLNVDMEALKAAIEGMIEKIKNDETVQGFFATMAQSGASVNMDGVSIELPEACECFIYTNTDDQGQPVDGPTFVTVDVTAKGETVNVDVLVAEPAVTVTVTLPSQSVTVQVSVEAGEAGFLCTVDVYNGEQFTLGLDAALEMGEEIVLDLGLYFMNPEKPVLTDTTVIAQGGERIFTITDEGKTVLTLGQIMQDEEGQLIQALLGDLMSNGLTGLLTRAAAVMPQELSGIMTMLQPAESAE